MDKNIFSIAKRIAEYLSGNEDIEGKQELEEWRKEYRNESLLQKITGDSRRRLEQRRYDDFPCQQGVGTIAGKTFADTPQAVIQTTVGLCCSGCFVFWIGFLPPDAGRRKREYTFLCCDGQY